jgi:hypothetical protein
MLEAETDEVQRRTLLALLEKAQEDLSIALLRCSQANPDNKGAG